MAESSFLTSHPLIDTMHLTGSDKTYQAIVWGPGAQQAENMKIGRRLNTKPFTCELGAVSPYIIAPGTEVRNFGGSYRYLEVFVIYWEGICSLLCFSSPLHFLYQSLH